MTSQAVPANAANEDLKDIREQLARRALLYIVAVGIIPVIASIARAWRFGWQPVMTMHVGLYVAAVAVVILGTRLTFHARALLMLGALWAVAIAGLLAWGLSGFGPVVLILFTFLAALLLGVRAGFAALLIALATLGGLSVFFITGIVTVSVDEQAYSDSWMAWINAAAATILIGGLIVFSAHLLFRELSHKVSAIRQTERETRGNRNFVDTVLETVGALVVVLDSEGRIKRFNRACELLTGYDSREVEGRRVWDFLIPPEEIEGVRMTFAAVTAGHFPSQHENDWVNRAGARRRISWTNTALLSEDGSVSHVVGTGLDVTERVRAEAALRDSEDRMRRSQAYANIGTWDWDVQTGAMFWSERVGPLLGYGAGVPETTYENYLEAIHPNDRKRVVDRVNACIERDAPYEVEYRVVWPDGTVHWLLERGGVTRAPDGQLLRMLGVVQDITERKNAETRLAESEQLFREFAANMAQVAWVRDLRSDRIIFANAAYERIWGRKVSSLLENPADFIATVHSEDLEIVQKAVAGQRHGNYVDSKYRIIRPDGEVRWIQARPFPIRDEAGNIYRIGGFAEDITAAHEEEAMRIERERRQRDALVREVHHRIKNHLQGVIGLLQRSADCHAGLDNILRETATQIRSIALVHGLQGQNPSTALLLCELVPSVARSVEEAMSPRHRIAIRMELGWSLQLTDEDAVPVALILNELLVNGIKHTPLRPENGVLNLMIREEDGVGRVSLTCPHACLPPGFDFEQGKGLGTGLQLVKALLPRRGARLRMTSESDGVLCELELWHPVVVRGTRLPTPPSADDLPADGSSQGA